MLKNIVLFSRLKRIISHPIAMKLDGEDGTWWGLVSTVSLFELELQLFDENGADAGKLSTDLKYVRTITTDLPAALKASMSYQYERELSSAP